MQPERNYVFDRQGERRYPLFLFVEKLLKLEIRLQVLSNVKMYLARRSIIFPASKHVALATCLHASRPHPSPSCPLLSLCALMSGNTPRPRHFPQGVYPCFCSVCEIILRFASYYSTLRKTKGTPLVSAARALCVCHFATLIY